MIGVKKFDQAPAIRHCHIVGPCGYENLISNLYVNTNFLIIFRSSYGLLTMSKTCDAIKRAPSI